jgi:hypothetical protein
MESDFGTRRTTSVSKTEVDSTSNGGISKFMTKDNALKIALVIVVIFFLYVYMQGNNTVQSQPQPDSQSQPPSQPVTPSNPDAVLTNLEESGAVVVN